jgi:hypothetical protein
VGSGQHAREKGGRPLLVPVNVAFTLDLFDYGDESIDVELPVDAIDVTDAFRKMLESGAGVRRLNVTT